MKRKQTHGDSPPHINALMTPMLQQPPVFSLTLRNKELRAQQAREATEAIRCKCIKEDEEKVRKAEIATSKAELRRIQQEKDDIKAAITKKETRTIKKRRDDED